MKVFVTRVVASLVLPLFVFTPTAQAELESDAEAAAQTFDPAPYEWAFGQVIDSITVHGNTQTLSIALLREMELRAGSTLNEEDLERDLRYLSDLSSIAMVDIEVQPLEPGHCALRVMVKERPNLLLKFVYPVLEYDFEKDRASYGAKLNDRNFRKQLESFSIDVKRNSVKDDNASIGWSTAWLGWQHIGMNARASYFHRSDEPVSMTIMEHLRLQTGVSLPLTDSRITFSQLAGGVALVRNRVGRSGGVPRTDVLVSPVVGYIFDGRDSALKPRRGEYFYVTVQASRVVNGEGSTYYWLGNGLRVFRPLSDMNVIAVQSELAYQFGRYPEYFRFGLGGSGTLRGYESGIFRGAHRWNQAVEWRMYPFPRWYFTMPWLGLVDVTLAGVVFLDTGIVWNNEKDFALDRFHSGSGFGIRIYSPMQDVVRLELGFNGRGGVRGYFSTGVRF